MSMPDSSSVLGIRRLEAIHYYVRDLDRSRRFYVEQLGFTEIAHSSESLTERGHQRSLTFAAGQCRVICSTPVGEGGRAYRFLQKHPDGIGSLVFEVDDIEGMFANFERRGGTPITDVELTPAPLGSFETFVAATPFGDTTFRFVERQGIFPLYPGFEASPAVPEASRNRFGFSHFDHVTTNFETLAPALLWLEHVLGFQRFWQVEFHTDDVASIRGDEGQHGSGLRSVVMWDPGSGIKFANNEPQRPSFRSSQINVFHEQHRGDGVQHVALAVSDIITAVRGLRQHGVEFMPTPKAYYEALPARLASLRVGAIAESLAELETLEILVDGEGPGHYLLQIFLKDSAGLHGSADAGPFFYELIERRGDTGFGAGNFRALFESIEREQIPSPAASSSSSPSPPSRAPKKA
jgi:4-hydroxyphenylpyruvate dioxygenase